MELIRFMDCFFGLMFMIFCWGFYGFEWIKLVSLIGIFFAGQGQFFLYIVVSTFFVGLVLHFKILPLFYIEIKFLVMLNALNFLII